MRANGGIVLVFTSTILSVSCLRYPSRLRPKRIINGTPLSSRTSGYYAVQYYVFLGTRDKANLAAGALITSTIVQTACHVLGTENGRWIGGAEDGTGDELKRMFVVRSAWDTLAYVGYSKIKDMTAGIPSKKFLIHQMCAMLYYSGVGFWVTHDFGWIILESPIAPVPNKVSYAPVRSVVDLARYYALAELWTVCLVMGFGVTKVQKKFPTVDDKLAPGPVELMHGWEISYDYSRCKRYTRDWQEVSPDLKHAEVCTWICATTFAKMPTRISFGDSGGPITCDNEYTAIVSGGVHERQMDFIEGLPGTLSIFDALVFAVFENAGKYRRSFVAEMENYAQGGTYSPPTVSIYPKTFDSVHHNRAYVCTHSSMLSLLLTVAMFFL